MQVILDNQFDDLDLLNARTQAWDLDFRLLQGGGFSGRIRQVATPEILITFAQFGSKLHQAGTTPPGYRTFAIPSGGYDFWWLGFEIDSRSVMRFGADSELACVSGGDFAVYTLSVSNEYLERLADSLGVPHPEADRGVTRIAATEMSELVRLARTAVFVTNGPRRGVASQRFVERLLVYCSAGDTIQRHRLGGRDEAIKRVIAYIDAHGHTQPSMADLCEIAHVSERTLQYAFRARFGVTPIQFVRCWKLNVARRLLKSSSHSGRTIASLAAECGFLDPSVFARHYHLLHGELPSATAVRTHSDSGKATSKSRS
jgi:AraC family ethanolamine operon transcriptional activator